LASGGLSVSIAVLYDKKNQYEMPGPAAAEKSLFTPRKMVYSSTFDSHVGGEYPA
jgi:hypothetical protein